MVEHVSGGILGALHILKDHWGAVGRDLAAAHYTWDDACSVLPFDQFISFILFAPPGTAVFHVLNEGWTADTFQLTSLLDVASMLLWSKTKDAQETFPKYKPEPFPRPGPVAEIAAAPAEMTVGDYLMMIEGGSA